MGNGCNVSQHSVLLLKTKTTNLKRYSETKCIACVSCKLYTYSQSQCLAWDTKRLQHADVIQTSTETSIRLRVSESLEILPPQAQKTPQEVSLHLITFFFSLVVFHLLWKCIADARMEQKNNHAVILTLDSCLQLPLSLHSVISRSF